MSQAVKNIALAHDASAESLLGEIVDDFLERLRHGEHPDIEEYAGRFPQLAAVVRQMLPAVQAIHSSVASPGSTAEDAAETKPEGPLGDFRIVGEIGRGGMGIVYEAVQLSLGRRVALKVLPLAAALDSRQLQRFKNEVQAAAHLHHPNIVPVYAVGYEQGVHFYAMQFIEGRTLADLIDELRGNAECRNPSSFDVRHPSFYPTLAGLAVQAAEALEHAHAVGIVHRDIKPANLLVDVRGNLWITDFGLAHVQTDTRLTFTGDLVGTLRYMSPEQALAQRGGLDHRCDVYSLGATLYELLTLEPAFEGRDHQELLRQIAFEEPRPPRRVNPAIPADLETIVLKAMAKSPTERYATAQELSDDLRRFLQDQPIRARRPSALQRLRKWGRRHRTAVWSAAAGLLLTLMVSAASIGWVVRDRAAVQASWAALEAKTAIGIQAALAEAQRWREQDKWRESVAAATRAEALMASGRVSNEVRQEVLELVADLRMCAKLDDVRLLRSGVRNGRFDSQAEDLGYASAFREYGIDLDALDVSEAARLIKSRAIRIELAAALDNWARRRRSVANPDTRSWEDLLAVALEVDPDPVRTSFRQAVLRGDREALIAHAASKDISAMPPVTLILLAEHLGSMGRYKEITPFLRRARELHPSDFWINHHLAYYLVMTGQPDEAIAYYTAAVALRPDSPGLHVNLGVAHSNQGQLQAAIAAARRAIDLKPDYAEAHCNLGLEYAKLGQQDKALAAFRQAILHAPQLARAHYNLGITLEMKGELDEAIAAYQQAIRLSSRDLAAHINLAGALLRKQRWDESIAVSRKAIELNSKMPVAHYNLGLALAGQGHLDDALAAYRQAIALEPGYASAHCNLGVVLERQGQRDEAIDAYRKAVDYNPDLFEPQYNLGRCLTSTGHLDEAIAALRRASAIKPTRAPSHYDLGRALAAAERLAEAAAAYQRAVELDPDYAEAWCHLGDVLRQQGQFAEALAALNRGHELGSKRDDWPYPSARWIDQWQLAGKVSPQFSALLRGEVEPGGIEEQSAYALLCHDQKFYAACARLRRDVLSGDPHWADDLHAGYRFEAACAAALAGCGQGSDNDQLDDAERASWRQQALAWLQADLDAYQKRLVDEPNEHRLVHEWLSLWRSHPDLAGLREADQLMKLPLEEQQAYLQLWVDVQTLLSATSSAP